MSEYEVYITIYNICQMIFYVLSHILTKYLSKTRKTDKYICKKTFYFLAYFHFLAHFCSDSILIKIKKKKKKYMITNENLCIRGSTKTTTSFLRFFKRKKSKVLF